MEINLDKYPLPKTYIRNREECFFDPIRKKLIKRNPEEEVRQKVVLFLHYEMGVPFDMMELEVPMSYFEKGTKGRADIIVYSLDKEGSKRPILIVECKAMGIPLIDDVFEQVYKYEDILWSNTIMVTNGTDLFIESWNEATSKYIELKKLPSYEELSKYNNLGFYEDEPIVYQRRKYEDFTSNEVIEFYQGHFGDNTDPSLWTFIINLNELLWDDTKKIPYKNLYGIEIIEDIGIRYTSFGNAAGFDWVGDYRSFITKDDLGNNQIISIAIMHGYIVVALDDYKLSHNSLQLRFQSFTSIKGKMYTLHHNGRLALSNKGGVKWNEVIDFVRAKAPELVDKNNKIYLGTIDNSKEFSWEQDDIKDFFGRLIKYSFIRDRFRKYKLKQLEEKKV